MSFNKRGQVTIFVIIGLVIIISIIVFMTMRIKIFTLINKPSMSENPLRYISDCVEEITKSDIKELLKTGGFANPKINITYKGNNLAVLCYSNLYNTPCTNQEPLLIKGVNEEIKEKILEEVDECFSGLKEDLENKGFSTSSEEIKRLEVRIENDRIIVEIKKPLVIMINDESKNYEEFKGAINSKTYQLLRAAQELLSEESLTCDSDYVNYQIINPQIRILKSDFDGEYKIYSITSKITMEELNFAIRGCVNTQ